MVLSFSGLAHGAKGTDDEVVIAYWECGSDDPKWFSISIMAPFLFKAGKGAQWSSELLATLAALKAWADESLDRKSVGISGVAGTDNKSNEGLSIKRSTTRCLLDQTALKNFVVLLLVISLLGPFGFILQLL